MIEIKNRYTGEVIHSGEFKSVKECVEDAVRRMVSLRGSDLRESDLSRSDLSESDLSGSDLSGSDLSESDLNGVIGDGLYIKSLQSDLWPVTYTATHMQIGCENHAIEDCGVFQMSVLATWISKRLSGGENGNQYSSKLSRLARQSLRVRN